MAKVTENIQQRVAVDEKLPEIIGLTFVYKGKTGTVVGVSNSKDLVKGRVPKGVQVSGGQDQYIVEGFSKEHVEVLLYWYRRMEGTHQVILDSMREGSY